MILCCLLLGLTATVGFGQKDTTILRRPAEPAVTPPARSDVPVTSPPTTPSSAPQLSPNPVETPAPARNRRVRRRLRTVPPSDPNAFGVGVTIEKDTTRRRD